MSRFTDETKWSDKWYRKLEPEEKLVWQYLCDKCDIAGFIEIDTEYMVFLIGYDIEIIEQAMKGLKRGYLGANNDSDWIWIKNFLKHQKNLPLNLKNNCHKGIISRITDQLEKFPNVPKYVGASEGLFSPIGKGKGNSKRNSKGNSKGKKEDQEIPEAEEVLSLDDQYLEEIIDLVKPYKKSFKMPEERFEAFYQWALQEDQFSGLPRFKSEKYFKIDMKLATFYGNWMKDKKLEADPDVIEALDKFI